MSEPPKHRLLTTAQAVEEQRQGALLLDIRPAEQFAALHIRGSIQISLMGRFSSWAAILIDPAQKLVLIAENERAAAEATVRLARVGLLSVIGYLLADERQWHEQELDLASISKVRCQSVLQMLRSGPSVQLVDVRSRAEWLKGHLPGAISVPLLDLDSQAPLIDASRSSLVYCHEGFRATTAASILLRKTSAEIGILIDGVEGWSALGLPLEVPDSK